MTMGAFGGLILTNRGKTLQSKAQAGVTLEYTRIAIGDGQLGTTPILDLNALRHQVKSLPITKLKVFSGGKAVVGTVWSNSDLTEGFFYREIGIFAKDPDLGEILYCYANSGELAEYIPPGGGSDLIERSLDIQVLVGNAANVTAIIDSSLVYATKPDLDALEQTLTQQIETLENTVDEHQAEDASLTEKGHVQLTNSVTSTSEVLAATAKAVKTAMDRADAAFQSASDGKTAVANAITAKGVTASPTDTFPTLATKIGQINTGKKWASGTLSNPGVLQEDFKQNDAYTPYIQAYPLTVGNLAFRPRTVVITSLNVSIDTQFACSLDSGYGTGIYTGATKQISVMSEPTSKYAYFSSNGFKVPVAYQGGNYFWIAIE